MDVAQRIKDCRERAGLSQVDLANESGLANSTISDYEHGRSQPSPHAISLLAEGLGTTPGYLMFGGLNENTLTDEEQSLLLHWRRREWGSILFMLSSKVTNGTE